MITELELKEICERYGLLHRSVINKGFRYDVNFLYIVDYKPDGLIAKSGKHYLKLPKEIIERFDSRKNLLYFVGEGDDPAELSTQPVHLRQRRYIEYIDSLNKGEKPYLIEY